MRIPEDLPEELRLYYYHTPDNGNVIMCVPETLLSYADKAGRYSDYMAQIPVRYVLDKGYRVHNRVIVINVPYDPIFGVDIDGSYYDYTQPAQGDATMVFEVGKCYPDLVTGSDSLCHASISGSSINLHVEYANPTMQEVDNYESGAAEVRFADADGSVFLLAKFGSLNWIDCPLLLGGMNGQLDPVSPGYTYTLYLSFFDSLSGKLLINRLFGLPRQEAIKLHSLYTKYKNSGLDPASEKIRAAQIQSIYKTSELLRFS